MGNDRLFQKGRKGISRVLAFVMAFSIVQPFFAYAAVIDGAPENILSGPNNGYVNRSNSGTYAPTFSVSGSLDAGDVVYVEVLSWLAPVASGAYVSSVGGESSGSVSPIDFSILADGDYVLSGSVSNGPVVTASGIVGNITKDTVSPVVSSTGTYVSDTGSVAFSGIAVADAHFASATLSYSGVAGWSETGTIILTGPSSDLAGSVTGLSPNATYLYTLSATDLAGNSMSQFAGVFSTAFDWGGLYSGIGAGLVSGGIVNNFSGVSNANVTAYSGLYFEKPTYGRITFAGALDLTNSGTVSFLQNLGNYLDMSGGRIGFAVSSGSTASGSLFQSAGATINVYFPGQPFSAGALDPNSVIVRDNAGNVLSSSGILSNLLCAVAVWGTQTCMFDASHFTTFDFKPILSQVRMVSNNAVSTARAKVGDVVTLSFTGSEALTGVTATMSGVNNESPLSVRGSGVAWTATGTVTSMGTIASPSFSIGFSDMVGNVGDVVRYTTDSSNVSIDSVAPSVVLSSSAPATITGAISVNASFSESSTGFALGDISVSNGTASALSQTSATGYSFTVTPSASTGSMTVSIGTGTFFDATGNSNAAASNTLAYTLAIPDSTPPTVSVTSHTNGQNVTGSTVTLTGSATDSGGIASVMVNGAPAALTGSSWSRTFTGLVAGSNAFSIIAADSSGNTGSTSVSLVRVPVAPADQSAALSGSTQSVVNFTTDISALGKVSYGTNSGSLNLLSSESMASLSHRVVLSGLVANTTYYYRSFGVSSGNTGSLASVSNFKTPAIIDTAASSATVTATGSAYLSGATTLGVSFASTGTVLIANPTGSDSVSLAMSGLTIVASGSWDGVFHSPEPTSGTATGATSGYVFTGSVYEIGSPVAELSLSWGSAATVSVNVGTSFSGQTLKVYRSTDGGASYSYLSDCLVSAQGDCTFASNQFSLFGFAAPSDSVPNAFTFSDVSSAELSASVESAAITVLWINVPSAISVTWGEYSIDGWAYVSSAGTVSSGAIVKVRVTSSPSYSTAVSATVTIGGISDAFFVTTRSAPSGGSYSGGGGSYSAPVPASSVTNGSGTTAVGSGAVSVDVPDAFVGSPNTENSASWAVSTLSLQDLVIADISNDWAKGYIEKLAIRGIVNNVRAFHPEYSLTRAEFLKIVGNAKEWDLTSKNSSFADVPQDAWFAPYVSYALNHAIISSADTFRPNDPITRAEAAKILIWALNIAPSTAKYSSFADVSPEHSLFVFIESARERGIFAWQEIGDLRFFRPDDRITRAEFSKVVVNAMGY